MVSGLSGLSDLGAGADFSGLTTSGTVSNFDFDGTFGVVIALTLFSAGRTADPLEAVGVFSILGSFSMIAPCSLNEL